MDLQIRRATLDDIPKLHVLWDLERLPSAEFERRFKEFQVAQNPDGEILGVIGLQIIGTDVRIHSEAFSQFDLADDLRHRFWIRFKVMGETQGWVRAWTELSSQPWREAGFDPATTAQLARLPDAFAVGSKGQWMMLQLREERTAVVPTDAEFELLKMEHQRENERLQRRAGVLRTIALLMAFGVIAWAGWWAVKLYRHRDHLPHP